MPTLRLKALSISVFAATALSSCAPDEQPSGQTEASGAPVSTFSVTSSDLSPDGTLNPTIIGAALYWCDGPGESIALEWTEPPAGTESFAIVMENETRPFYYWGAYDIDGEIREVKHGEAESLGAVTAVASMGGRSRISPCPEVGETHTIATTVYALSSKFDQEGLGTGQLEDVAGDTILASATVRGTVAGDPEPEVEDLNLSSIDFSDGAMIPDAVTAHAFGGACTGENRNPEFSWDQVPGGAASYALTMRDSSHNDFVHWILANIPADSTGIAAGEPSPEGSVTGRNGLSHSEYMGPCPLGGGDHEYVFEVWALDEELALETSFTYDQLVDAAEGHVIGKGKLMGLRARDS
ncbi:YbhB/YbcL family Raf kinase inhibitor-like protein [Demequina oxidasica]|uniref:YbhB/YbcL family Raf kinase inhibitor-like protein n=1 Tax=Demequina oxidasica TaxID=676199 RepID=UPI0007857DF4|nr:YbhB/YbcL family Raf kinase inhibitor-like protein [Demequina oxidasica]